MPTTTTPSSPRYFAFFANLRCYGAGSAEPRTRRSPCGLGPAPQPPPPRLAGPAGGGCARLDRVAAWVGGGVAAAFFASLERCSCVRVPTDDDRDDVRDAAAAPLISDDGNALAASHPHPHPHPHPHLRRTRRAQG